MKTFFICIVSMILLIPAAVAAEGRVVTKRKAKIAWKKIPQAAQYELQVDVETRFEQPYFQTKTRENFQSVELEPGEYYFRIRPMDAKGVSGAWSTVEGFVVNPKPPRAISPVTGSLINNRLPEQGMQFQWEIPGKKTDYPFEIRDEFGIVFSRTLDAKTIFWMPPRAGKYRWRVGLATQMGIEWGEFQQFEVSSDALPPPAELLAVGCSKIYWTAVNVGGVGVLQSGGGKNLTGFAGWNPHCLMTERFELNTRLGGNLLRDSADRLLGSAEIALSVHYYLTRHWSVGLGNGVQLWSGLGLYPFIRGEFGFSSFKRIFGFVEGVYLSGSVLFLAPVSTQDIRLGVRLGWGVQ